MGWVNSDHTPPVGFHFSVEVLNQNQEPSAPADATFQEVSGISVSIEPVQIVEGGENRFAARVPGRTKYEDLVLKRGLIVRSSALAEWCTNTFRNNLNERITPRIIRVSLLDRNSTGQRALATWTFHSAYPVKWDISPFDAQKSELVVESITFAYSYFEKKLEPAAKGSPFLPPPLE